MMLFCGGLGAAVGSSLERQEAVFIALIAFSVVALLYLVTQELLMEAFESGGGAWYVNMWLFVGVYAGIVLEKLTG